MCKKAALVLLVAVLALIVAPATFAQAAPQRRRRQTGLGVARRLRWESRRRVAASVRDWRQRRLAKARREIQAPAARSESAFIIGVALIESLTLYALVSF